MQLWSGLSGTIEQLTKQGARKPEALQAVKPNPALQGRACKRYNKTPPAQHYSSQLRKSTLSHAAGPPRKTASFTTTMRTALRQGPFCELRV